MYANKRLLFLPSLARKRKSTFFSLASLGSNTPRGFIALISAIIISAVLLIAAAAGSVTGMYSRFGVLDVEFKERSTALAEACESIVLSKLGEDSGYNGPDLNYPVGGDSCSIFVAQNPGDNPRIFKVRGIYQHTYTNVLISVDVDALTLVSVQEVAQ